MADENTKKRAWWKHWWGILLIVFLLLFGILVGYFFQQFFKYYSLARRGEISASEYQFSDKFMTSESLRARYANTPLTNTNVESVDDPRTGPLNTVLTIVEFADFSCPWSREESFIFREMMAKYGDRVRFIYRDFPVDELHPNARMAAEAAECARELGNFWAYHDKLFQNQERVGRSDLIRYATEIGLDSARFTSCIDSGRYRAEVQRDYDEGIAAGVRGTPTFFFNNKMAEGAIPRESFDRLIQALIE